MTNFAFLFDLDGVISNTATMHAKAWKVVFDKVLEENHIGRDVFDECKDYLRYLDGKSRLTGIQDYLDAYEIFLPLGNDKATGFDSVHGIGNTKNVVFRNLVEEKGVPIFSDALRLLEKLKKLGVDIGLASSSKNAKFILEKAKLLSYFKSIMDGVVAEDENIGSKPAADFYRHASLLLNRPASECIVLEDAISGIRSAANAGAGLVVGISRVGSGEHLINYGADIVISSLDELPSSTLSSVSG